ncbi:hypothetical protein CLOSTASPAR_05900 [[Clostridium] asparagiforme DSM 15981]|uniref:Uncharacterized protein n=1 Tax=[Clostridium] asparagiforme DSM 15981 TaxID=518636 RepID=C0D9E9_9FIRM|nr:hypothetical protein CLOSTASPAR_05900 [[Clostridium] asparagiforme DSM 15981]
MYQFRMFFSPLPIFSPSSIQKSGPAVHCAKDQQCRAALF